MSSSGTQYSAAYLAQSRVTEVWVGYSVPIPIEILTTLWRLWIKLRPSSKNGLAFDDYLILWATVRCPAKGVVFRKRRVLTRLFSG